MNLLSSFSSATFVCVLGDVGLLHLGMSLNDYQYLSTEVDVVVHAAAYVNLIYPYQVGGGV